MESRNPVLNREFADPQRYASFHEPPPTAEQLQTMVDGPRVTTGRRMTLDDVVMKTGFMFVVLVGISRWDALYAGHGTEDPNIVLQAVIGTFVAFGVMLLLYRSGRLRAT